MQRPVGPLYRISQLAWSVSDDIELSHRTSSPADSDILRIDTNKLSNGQDSALETKPFQIQYSCILPAKTCLTTRLLDDMHLEGCSQARYFGVMSDTKPTPAPRIHTATAKPRNLLRLITYSIQSPPQEYPPPPQNRWCSLQSQAIDLCLLCLYPVRSGIRLRSMVGNRCNLP